MLFKELSIEKYKIQPVLMAMAQNWLSNLKYLKIKIIECSRLNDNCIIFKAQLEFKEFKISQIQPKQFEATKQNWIIWTALIVTSKCKKS